MEPLEQLLEQECSENRLEDFLVYYSISTPPPLKPMEISFGSISAYADSLNKQFGISSTPKKPQVPSSAPTAETFNPLDIIKSLKNPYKPSINEEELAYANNLNKQFNAPSTALKPSTPSSIVKPQTFNAGSILDAVKNPMCPSLYNQPLTISSSPVKQHTPSPGYNIPQLKIPNQVLPKFEPSKLPLLSPLRPEKKFYDNFKEKHRINISGLKDRNPIYNLFKNNELPRIYDQVSKGLKLGNDAVKTITFTNPLKNKNDFSPSFAPYKRELRLPAIKPKTIPFDTLSQKDYNKILNNAFLPHELGHAKIEEKYGKCYPDIDMNKPELKGFHEHVADALALDSVKNTPQLFKTQTETIKFENTWATPHKDNLLSSRARGSYNNFMSDKENASFVPGKQATINMLGVPILKQKYDWTLKNVLDLKYGNDPHKETVYNNINKLSGLYQEQAIKLIDVSKRNNIFLGFKAKRILSAVEKETFRFMRDL